MVEAVAVINGVIEDEREDLVESKDPFLSTTFFTEKGRDVVHFNSYLTALKLANVS